MYASGDKRKDNSQMVRVSVSGWLDLRWFFSAWVYVFFFQKQCTYMNYVDRNIVKSQRMYMIGKLEK